MNSSVRNAVLWLVVLILVVLVFAVFKSTKTPGKQPEFSQLVQEIKDGKVSSMVINSATGDVTGRYKNGDEFRSTVPPTYNDFTTLLLDKGVQAKVEKDNGTNLTNILFNFLPFALIIGFLIFMIRQMQSDRTKAL